MKNRPEYQLNNNQQVLKDITGLLEDLYRVEEEILRNIVSADPRGMAAIIASSEKIVARGNELAAQVEQEQFFGDKEIEFQPGKKFNDGETAREPIMEILETVGRRHQINRSLLFGCLQMARGLQKICPADPPVYNNCGKIQPPAGDGPARLDQGR